MNTKEIQFTGSTTKANIQLGKDYVFFIPPSWLIVGRVTHLSDDEIVVDHAAYIENVTDGTATLAIGLAKDVSKAVSRSYPLPDNISFERAAVLIRVPCETDTSPLYASREANAIKGKR